MITLNVLDAYIGRLETDLAAEEAYVRALIADKAVGDNSGYWKSAHALRMRLKSAVNLRDALIEAGL